jgi:integrase
MPFIPNDSRPGDRVLGLAEFTPFRDALAGGAQDFADLSFWTGHRAADVHTMERWHLDCDHEWKDPEGRVVALGRFWRRSSKTKMHEGRPVAAPAWILMEPEARAVAQRLLARPGSRDSLLVGRVWGLSKSFAAACDRCGIPRISPSRDLRRSYASMLAARGYDRLYIQMALGHAGAMEYNMLGEFVRVRFATVADRSYIRTSPEMMVRQALLRRAG